MVRSALSPGEAEFVAERRVAYLASVDAAGMPHVVPVCPVLDGDRIVFSTDTDSQKMRNLRGDPHLALAFDEYSEDWTAYRQVIVWGRAILWESGPEFERCRNLVYEKFPQAEEQFPLEEGSSTLVDIEVRRVTSTRV
jgi:nitroimidazol reductase NimA-like FMN-containing flavoprotein (pyridoxamine 5'-phosphate oxidase superfamily)